MAFLISKQTSDTASVGPFCDYPAQPLEGSPFPSPNVRVGQIPVPIYDAASLPSIVNGIRRGEEYLSVLVQEIGWLLQLLTRQCLLMEGYPLFKVIVQQLLVSVHLDP